MYNALNELILFGGNSCNNAHSLIVKIVTDLNIPTLRLAYPTTQEEIIDLIDKTNYFLRNLESKSEIDVDLMLKKDKHPLLEVKKILNNKNF